MREIGFSRSNRRVSRSQFYNELEVSRAALSPFGYGEINIRDFECFSRGVLLIKPDVSHLETFPSFYQNTETYVPFRWDFSDFDDLRTPKITATRSTFSKKSNERRLHHRDVIVVVVAAAGVVVGILVIVLTLLSSSDFAEMVFQRRR